jgi:hypothetical protein
MYFHTKNWSFVLDQTEAKWNFMYSEKIAYALGTLFWSEQLTITLPYLRIKQMATHNLFYR